MLPDPHYPPAGILECDDLFTVPLCIAAQLGIPVRAIYSWPPPVVRTGVPKTTINEHRDPSAGERDIRADDFPGHANGVVLAEAISHPVERRAERDLGLCFASPDGSHVPGSAGCRDVANGFRRGYDVGAHHCSTVRSETFCRRRVKVLRHGIEHRFEWTRRHSMNGPLSCLEICAGAGGQSLGLEDAGFFHQLAVEIDPDACQTLRLNRGREFHRDGWEIYEGDVREISGRPYRGRLDLLAGGVPCPPFSIAGKQLGPDDERDLFPEALRLVAEARPRAVMLENVRGLASEKFTPYRAEIQARLDALGYWSDWKVLNASDFGLAQLRPRFILVALRRKYRRHFTWPQGSESRPTVGETLYEMMAERKWPGARHWADKRANDVGPTLVGGSRKHGGPDLGPTRARAAWLQLGVDGRGLANEAPDHLVDEMHTPKLTLEMAAALQGFPPDWKFHGRKTAAYRQIGNAFPPPVAEAVGSAIAQALGVRAIRLHGTSGTAEACSA